MSNQLNDLSDSTTEAKTIEILFDERTNCTIKKGRYFVIVKGKIFIKLDKRSFRCPYKDCGKLFKEKGNLRTHIRVHVLILNLN
jgi:uncharacterized Zn-finger protein